MNSETYILQVALVGIFVVVVVLIAMIYFVKAQALLLRLFDRAPAPVAQPLDTKDQRQQKQLQEQLSEELSREEIAAISAVIFMMIGRPVRITSINVIPPQIK